MKTIKTLGFALPLLLALGCDNQNAKSPYDVSVDQESSALGIPSKVDRTVKRIGADESETKTAAEKMPTMADKLSETDWAIVGEIIEASDKAGMDGAYAAEMRELSVVRGFYDEEKDDIHKKVNGAVSYMAKDCSPQGGIAVNQAMNTAMDERYDERLKGSNDAFLIIDRNRDALGKKNVPALEEMAKTIAKASFVVHVEMPEAQQELEGAQAAASDAKDALKKMIEAENEPPKEGSKPSAEAEKAKKDRVKKAEEKLKAAEAAEEAAKKQLENLEQRTIDLEKAYDDGLSKLKDAVAAKKK